jgi:membrane protease YdiL (CAAX protease family)
MAGEGLTRYAFPGQIQQWRFWSPGVANSTPALGRTVAAYLLVGLHLGYVVLFYFLTSRLDGWWTPAETLVAPDLLATYLPGLSAASMSLFAALWEESVFRAVPIAIAAIAGMRFGRQKIWIVSAILIQALVFAASHANYPQMPAYARIVELTAPAIVWGFVYLHFGLVPTILAHFAYNLSLSSVPLFAMEVPGIWANRLFLILVGLIPLFVVVGSRLRRGAASAVPDWAFNRAWSPSRGPEGGAVPDTPPPSTGPAQAPSFEEAPPLADAPDVSGPPSPDDGEPSDALPHRWKVAAGVAALSGMILWASSQSLRPPSPTIGIDLSEAVDLATAAAVERGMVADAGWRPLPTIRSNQGLSHDFVWEAGGEEVYSSLLGSYLREPHWYVRFVRFHALPEERVEEYQVLLDGSGMTRETRHRIPEARPGASLEEEAARDISRSVVESHFPGRFGDLEEIAAEETTQPARTDWTFTYRDSATIVPSGGEARFVVRLAGESILGAERLVHVPEDWARERRAQASRRLLIVGGSVGFFILLFGACAVVGIVKWSRRSLETRPLMVVGFGVAIVSILAALNGWPSVSAGFTTLQPYGLQAGAAIIGVVLSLLVLAFSVGLNAALAHTWLPGRRADGGLARWLGLGLGLLVAGLFAALALIPRSTAPDWPSYGSLVTFAPAAEALLTPLMDLFLGATVLLLIVAILEQRTQGWRKGRSLPALGLLVLGLALMQSWASESLALWLLFGVIAAVGMLSLYWLAREAGWAVLPWVVCGMVIAEQAEVWIASPGVGTVLAGLLGVALLLAVAVRWDRSLATGGV